MRFDDSERIDRLKLKLSSVVHWYIPDVCTSFLPVKKKRNTIGGRFDRHRKLVFLILSGQRIQKTEDRSKKKEKRKGSALCPFTVRRIIKHTQVKGSS